MPELGNLIFGIFQLRHTGPTPELRNLMFGTFQLRHTGPRTPEPKKMRFPSSGIRAPVRLSWESKNARMRERKNARTQECRSARVRER